MGYYPSSFAGLQPCFSTSGLGAAPSPHISFLAACFLALMRRKVNITSWEILILLAWGWDKRPIQFEQFWFAWRPGESRGANESFTHLDPSQLPPAWWLATLCGSWLYTVQGSACLSMAYLGQPAWHECCSFHNHCCTGSDFSEKQMYD